MIKWTITYPDYNGNEITEDFYFHYNKAELMEMNFNADGAYSEFIKRIGNNRDYKALGQEFKQIILGAYGVKSDNGKVFRKSPEATRDFEQSEAYPTLYMELIADTDKMVKFVRGLVPKDLQGELNAPTAVPNANPTIV